MSKGMTSLRVRLSVLAASIATLVTMLSALAPAQASASIGFCENVKLGPGATCVYSGGFGPVETVLGEVTSGSAEICVAIDESSGVLLGKQCGLNKAQSQAGIGASNAKAWIKNNSKTATVTVTGIFNT